MRNLMKLSIIFAIFVLGFAVGTAGVVHSWVSGGQKKIAYKPAPKWEIPFHRDAFKGYVPHFYALKMLCSQPGSKYEVCELLEEVRKLRQENKTLKSEVFGLKKQVKKMESAVSVLDADLKHRLEKERRREERRKARREARLERKRKRKEQERKRREFEAEQERLRWEHCPRTKHGLFTPSSCIIP